MNQQNQTDSTQITMNQNEAHFIRLNQHWLKWLNMNQRGPTWINMKQNATRWNWKRLLDSPPSRTRFCLIINNNYNCKTTTIATIIHLVVVFLLEAAVPLHFHCRLKWKSTFCKQDTSCEQFLQFKGPADCAKRSQQKS